METSAKKCTQCKTIKELSEFGKDKSMESGLNIYCKICHNENTKLYKRTKNGIVCKMYDNQKNNSALRGHTPPTYNINELREWINSQENFEKLYNDWVESGYLKAMKPSIDRLDDYKGYSLDNIQLITFKENKLKADNDRKRGVSTSGQICKKVRQYSLDGIFLEEFHSIAEAARQTGALSNSISKCCNYYLNHTSGYKWEFR